MVWFCPSKVPPYRTSFELALYPMGVHCLKVSFFSVFSVPSVFNTSLLTVISAVSTALAWGSHFSLSCRLLTISANPYSSFALLIWYTPFSSLSGTVGVMVSVSANAAVGSRLRQRRIARTALSSPFFISIPPVVTKDHSVGISLRKKGAPPFFDIFLYLSCRLSRRVHSGFMLTLLFSVSFCQVLHCDSNILGNAFHFHVLCHR